jgi:hypothetical protein
MQLAINKLQHSTTPPLAHATDRNGNSPCQNGRLAKDPASTTPQLARAVHTWSTLTNHQAMCATLLYAPRRSHHEPRSAHTPQTASSATRLHAQSRSRHEPRGALDPVPRRSASRQDWSIQRASTSGTRRADHQAEVARSPNSTIHPNPANAHMPEQCLHDLRSQPSRASETTPWTRPAGLEPGQHYAQTQQRAQQQASNSKTQPTEPSDENDTTRARDDPSPAPQRHGPPGGAPSSDPHDPWVCALVPLRLTPSSAQV